MRILIKNGYVVSMVSDIKKADILISCVGKAKFITKEIWLRYI